MVSFRMRMAAVAAVVLLAGCTSGDPGTAVPTPTEVASQPHEPVSEATPTPLDGEIAPGRYATARNTWAPVTFAFDIAVPGWIAQNDGQTITKHVDDSAREISWSVEILDSLFATPCGDDDPVAIGPTVDDLVTGLQALPDLQVSEPTDLTIDGRAGQMMELSLPEGLDEASCDPPIGVQVWLDQAGGKYLVVGGAMTTRVYAVDVDGARFVLNVNIAKTADPADLAEFEAILGSMTFHP